MFLNKIRVFLLINLHIVILLTSPENLKAKELKIITGIAKVIDGDTILINKKKIRLFGIDAPERDQKCQKIWLTIYFFSFNKDYFCGEISTNRLKKKINNQFMSCKWKNKDRYKRFIAECFKGKTNINAWMVRYGYAVAYRKYSKKYVAHEEIAKKDKLGLWSGTFEMPWDYRKKN